MDTLKIVGASGKSILCKDGKVKIIKQGGLLSTKREKIIPASNISAIEVKKPGGLFRGYIQVQLAGQASSNSSYTLSGGTYDAVKDENAVLFDGDDNYQIAKKIQQHILDFSAPLTTPAATGSCNPISAADEIVKFKKLLDDGVISASEFERKKSQLLG